MTNRNYAYLCDVAQELKTIIRDATTANDRTFTALQLEALDQLATGIADAATGDPNDPEPWTHLCGWFRTVLDDIEARAQMHTSDPLAEHMRTADQETTHAIERAEAVADMERRATWDADRQDYDPRWHATHRIRSAPRSAWYCAACKVTQSATDLEFTQPCSEHKG